MINREDLIHNSLFQERYIKENIGWYFSYLCGKRGFARIFKIPYATFLRRFYLKRYFEKRALGAGGGALK